MVRFLRSIEGWVCQQHSQVGPVEVQPQLVPDCVNMWFGQDIVGEAVYILFCAGHGSVDEQPERGRGTYEDAEAFR